MAYFVGKVVGDPVKPDGEMRKPMDAALLTQTGWKANAYAKNVLRLSMSGIVRNSWQN